MATEYKNVKRIVAPSRVELEQELSERMLGFETATGSIGAKKLAGDMSWFTPEGGDAKFASTLLTDLSGNGQSNIGVDNDGNVIIRPDITDVDYIDFVPQTDVLDFNEGRLWYNESEHTMQYHSDNPNFVNYVNNAQTIRAKNETGFDIPISTVVDIYNITGDGSGLQMHIADAYDMANKSDEGWAVAVTTEECLAGEVATCCFYGTILGVNTVGLNVGEPTYLGSNGTLTNSRPNYPAESILVGTSIFEDAVNGVLAVKITNDAYDYEFDGTTLEKQNTTVVVDNGVVYMDVCNLEYPTRELPIQIAGTIYQLDTVTGAGVGGAARVALINGTETISQSQTVYVDIVGGVPTLKVTAGYPAVPYSEIASVSLLDVATTITDGALLHRRMNTSKANNGRGRISYISERMFINSPKWWEGVTPTATITPGTPDILDLSVLAGIVYQTHKQDYPSLSISTDGIYVANGVGGTYAPDNYTKYNNLIDLCGYVSSDVSRDTSSRGHLVVFGLINKDTQECKMMVNLPSDLYGSSDSQAYFDYDGTATYSVISDLRLTAFLIARVPFDISNPNNVSFINPVGSDEIINLLGNPIGIVGGGSGGGGTYIPNLTEVLTVGNDAGNVQIKNLANGTLDQDSATVSQSNLVKVSVTDSVASYLSGKIVEGDNITIYIDAGLPGEGQKLIINAAGSEGANLNVNTSDGSGGWNSSNLEISSTSINSTEITAQGEGAVSSVIGFNENKDVPGQRGQVAVKALVVNDEANAVVPGWEGTWLSDMLLQMGNWRLDPDGVYMFLSDTHLLFKEKSEEEVVYSSEITRTGISVQKSDPLVDDNEMTISPIEITRIKNESISRMSLGEESQGSLVLTDVDQITNAPIAKEVITKEYADANYGTVKVSSVDSTPDYLTWKLVAGHGINIIPEGGAGTNQKLRVNAAVSVNKFGSLATETSSHGTIVAYSANINYRYEFTTTSDIDNGEFFVANWDQYLEPLISSTNTISISCGKTAIRTITVIVSVSEFVTLPVFEPSTIYLTRGL